MLTASDSATSSSATFRPAFSISTDSASSRAAERGRRATHDHEPGRPRCDAVQGLRHLARDVERQRFLDRLRIERDLLEGVVLAAEARLVLVEEPGEDLEALIQHRPAVGFPLPRLEDLELVPHCPDADPEQDPAAAQGVERRELLGEQHGVPEGHDDHPESRA